MEEIKMKPTIVVFGLEDDAADIEFISRAFDGGDIHDYVFYRNSKTFFENFDKNVLVAVIDFHLPGTDGYEVLKKIRSINKRCRVTIISGGLTTKTLKQLWNTGAQKFVEKAYGWEMELVEFVKEHIVEVQEEIATANEIKALFKSNA